jgi:ferritin
MSTAIARETTVKMTDDLASAFNDQVTMELASSVAYLQMSAHFEAENLTGMAAWMRMQSEEEKEHAHRFLEFVLDRGNLVSLGSIDAPRPTFDSVEQVFAAALQQEQAVTRAIHELYRLASDRGDLASFPFLQSFIEEQNEEEATVETILERVRLAGGESSAILLLDNELGARGS